jgi:type I restriction enzyme S subunit
MNLLDKLFQLVTRPEDVARVREMILQLAVQGRLVAQNPADEPAALLLERIQAEKKRLVAEGKLKPEKELPPITPEEEPYPLPAGWAWTRLQTISSYIQRGKSPVYSEIKIYPVVSQKCVQWSGFDLSKARFIDPLTLTSYSSERFLQIDDLLWNSTGLGTLGRIAVCDVSIKKYEHVVVDSHVTIIRLLRAYLIPKFIALWLSSQFIQTEVSRKATGSTKQTELNLATVLGFEIPLPPLAEQERIVAQVNHLLALCDQLENQFTTFEHTRQTLLASIIATTHTT